MSVTQYKSPYQVETQYTLTIFVTPEPLAAHGQRAQIKAHQVKGFQHMTRVNF